jgi:nitroimidazol reductase NimA-like FMN-containing flavoprotein (pyridoxamine 5'-phosphate oxidase superfamily)
MSPVVVSLWFLYADETLWCATQRSAKTVSLLRENPKCGFEIAGERQPYRGVRGQGIARIDSERGPAVLERLIARYLEDGNASLARWLRSRSDSEVAVAIRPSNFHSWDYSHRMRAESE